MKSYFLYSGLSILIGLLLSLFLNPSILLTSSIYSYLTYTLKLGIILGILAFLAQVLVTYTVLPNFPKSDKQMFALAQYNGITSIILSSLVLIYYNQTVAIISVAIITISILYFSTNSLIRA